MPSRIPFPHPSTGPLTVGRPYLDQDDADAVTAVLLGPGLGSGGAVERFESGLAQVTGAAHVVAVANGQAALQLAYQMLGIGPGRRVLTTANATPAVATAAQAIGGTVEFLDIDLGTGNLDLRLLEERLEQGDVPHVVTAVHSAGLPCDMEWLLALKRRHDFFLVEDASQALGARYRVDGRWVRVGEHAEIDASVLSFAPAEHLTTGEGGAVLVHDGRRAHQLRRLCAHGVDPESVLAPFNEPHPGPGGHPWFRPVVELGVHGGMSDLQAALGASQLAKLPDFLEARREIALRYLAELRDYVLPHPGGLGETAEREHAWQRFVIRCEPAERDGLFVFLHQHGIQAGVHHYPLPLHPWFRERAGTAHVPRAVEHARTALSLPLFPSLSDEDQGRVIAALADWKRARRSA